MTQMKMMLMHDGKTAKVEIARNMAHHPDRPIVDYKYTLLHEGQLLPVVNMMDLLGEQTTNPLHAFMCVCYFPENPKSPWLATETRPGEIAMRKEPL